MKIQNEHLYHGAGLVQVAEHESFKAINAIRVRDKIVHAAYRINAHIAVYFKHATHPKKPFDEYVFSFDADHIKTIRNLAEQHEKTFIALVCVDAREVCLLTVDQLNTLISRRQKAKGGTEDTYTVLVTAQAGNRLRVYVNAPGKKKTTLGDPLIVSRTLFPAELFS